MNTVLNPYLVHQQNIYTQNLMRPTSDHSHSNNSQMMQKSSKNVKLNNAEFPI
jgi:hypothetical protein